jgi:hypothetical protein
MIPPLTLALLMMGAGPALGRTSVSILRLAAWSASTQTLVSTTIDYQCLFKLLTVADVGASCSVCQMQSFFFGKSLLSLRLLFDVLEQP